MNLFLIAFGLLTASLLLAWTFGRLFCSEHRWTLPAWIVAGAFGGIGWLINENVAVFVGAGISVAGLAINGWLHGKALADQAKQG